MEDGYPTALSKEIIQRLEREEDEMHKKEFEAVKISKVDLTPSKDN